MDKEETIIQTYNDEKCQYEYRVKGYDITESVKVLLKAHKEEYDRQKFNFGEVKGYCDGMRDAEKKITDLEAKLAEQYAEVEKVEQHYLKQREYYLNEFNEIIDNLKQQLAEKEELIEFYINSGKEQCDEINRINHHATNQAEEIDRLNNQLAEKETEIEIVKNLKAEMIEARIKEIKGE